MYVCICMHMSMCTYVYGPLGPSKVNLCLERVRWIRVPSKCGKAEFQMTCLEHRQHISHTEDPTKSSWPGGMREAFNMQNI